MRKKALRLTTILILVAVPFLVIASVAVVREETRCQNLQKNNQTKRKSLREIAKERDVEIADYSESEAEYSDLGILAKHANAIVLGRIIDAESSFSGDDHIITSYDVEVLRVLKPAQLSAALMAGQAPPAPLSTPLKIVRTGGVVNINGHRAA